MENKRSVNFDILTIIACFMVVAFHCNNKFYDFSQDLSWRVSVVIRCIVYSAIPIFFMLTGAKLFAYRERYTTKEYVKKRISRVLVPFIFWNVFYICYPVWRTGLFHFNSAKEFFSTFFDTGFNARYWFFWPLFAVYTAIPVISLLLEVKGHRKYLWYTVLVTFVITWVLKPVLNLIGIEVTGYISMPIASGFLMYSIFGYLISTEEWTRSKRVVLYICGLLGGIFAIVFTILSSNRLGVTVQAAVQYTFFPAGLTGASIFVFVKNIKFEPKERTKKIISSISGTCMGIWLTHSLVINFVLGITGVNENSYVCRFVFPFVVFAICSVGVYLLKKIPYLRRIV